MVQAADPDPVVVVLEVVPVNAVISEPDAAALPRALVTVLMSVATFDSIAITLPATGAVREVMVVA
jgi:hypothetical protein